MKPTLVAALGLVAIAAHGQHPVSAHSLDGTLDPYIDFNPGYVFPMDYRMIGFPTTSIGSPSYSSETVGPTTKQVAHFSRDTFFRALHGLNANGMGAYVNQYSLLFDVQFLPDGDSWASFFNTNYDNQNDGDTFLRWDGVDVDGPFASLGISGVYGGMVRGNQWVRLIVTVDCGYNVGSGTRLIYYLNGIETHRVELSDGIDGRFAAYSYDDGDLDSDAIDVMADNDLDQTPGKLSQVAFYNTVLSPEEAAGFGGPGRFVLPGDANLDGYVDIGDYALLSNAYNSFDGDPNYSTLTDFNNDGAVDIADYAILSAYYGT